MGNKAYNEAVAYIDRWFTYERRYLHLNDYKKLYKDSWACSCGSQFYSDNHRVAVIRVRNTITIIIENTVTHNDLRFRCSSYSELNKALKMVRVLG